TATISIHSAPDFGQHYRLFATRFWSRMPVRSSNSGRSTRISITNLSPTYGSPSTLPTISIGCGLTLYGCARSAKVSYLPQMNSSEVARINSSIALSDIARYEAQAFNHYLEPQGAPTEVASNKEGLLDISAVVQRGGILVLTPINSGRPGRGSPDN